VSGFSTLRERYRVTSDPLRTERRLELGVLVLALVLLVQVVWGITSLLTMSAPELVEPAADTLRVAGVQASEGVAPEQSNEIRERPLFWEGRRPVSAAGADTGAAADTKPTRREGEIELRGIFDGEGATGIIAVVKGERYRILLGEEAAGWQLVSVGPRSAVVQAGKRREELQLEQSVAAKGGKVRTRGGVDKKGAR